MKIGIWLPNWIGDVVMATPALRAVQNQFRNAEIVGIMRPYVADVLAGTSLLDRVLLHDLKDAAAENSGWPLLKTLRRERFDIAILLLNSIRSALWAWASGAKRIIGYARNGRSPLLTDAVPAPSQATPHPVLDEMLQLVAQVGCHNVSRRMELATLPSDEQRLDDFWQRHPQLASSDYVCLNTGGAFGAAKDWPAEHFSDLARRISQELHRSVLIVCGPNERATARQIVADVNLPNVVSLADEAPSVGLTKAAIRHASFLVTTDSGPRHFAAAFDVPTLTLFGPTHIAWSETYHPLAVHLQLPLDCGPCQQRICPRGHHRCMQELSVESVFVELARRLPTATPLTGRSAA